MPFDLSTALLVDVDALASRRQYLLGAFARLVGAEPGDRSEHDTPLEARPAQSEVDDIRGGAARIDPEAEAAEIVVPMDSPAGTSLRGTARTSLRGLLSRVKQRACEDRSPA